MCHILPDTPFGLTLFHPEGGRFAPPRANAHTRKKSMGENSEYTSKQTKIKHSIYTTRFGTTSQQ